MERVTTTRNFGGFVREDITYKNPRMQRQILDDLPREYVDNPEPEVPASSTPEQVILYFEECIAKTQDTRKKHIYGLTIKWIKELEEHKKAEIIDLVKSFNMKKVEEDDSGLDNVEAE